MTAHAAQGISNEEVSRKAFNIIEETSQQAVNEMRALIWQLKPVGLEQGLVKAIQNYSDVLQLDLTVSVEGLINLPSNIEENIYRIIQEGMNNTKKHAQDTEIKLKLSQNQDYFYVEIKDYGIGFNMQQTSYNNSHGINNMKQRAKAVKANIDITSEENNGTQIYIKVPL